MADDNFDDYFDYLEQVEEDIEDMMNRGRLPKRYIRDAENPLEFYADTEFRSRYRFDKQVVLNVILPLIAEGVDSVNNRGLPIPPLMKLLICLRFYSTASFQVVCGDLRKVGQSSVSLIVKTVSILLAEKAQDFVKFPETVNDQRNNILLFHQLAGFPSVAGCVDGTHIRIGSPGGDNAEVFRNRKGYFSLNVQVVGGPKMEILDLVVRHPGSTHDSVIFDRSALRVRFEQTQIRGLLLGDNGYACRPYLLTPIIHPANPQEERYNRAHKRTRNLVERVFGLWKRRFPCVHRQLNTNLDTTIAIICATAVLYNIGLQYNNYEIEEADIDDNVNANVHINNNQAGLAFRRQFIIQHF